MTTVTIPNGINIIEGSTFSDCISLTSISSIPNSVTSIGSDAFRGCTSLTNVTIPNSVVTIGQYAFESTGLTSVIIPSSVTSIGNRAFAFCENIASISVENGNGTYDSRNNCNAIIETASNTLIAGCKTTIIPNSVTSIGDDAFSKCSGLTSVTIPNSVTSIGNSAFSGCSGLTSVTIPNSVTSIGYDAFKGCTGLTSVTIGNGVTSIRERAFENCTGLTSVTIGNSVTSIGSDAFRNCSGLSSVEFHCAQIGSWFKGMTSIKEVVIGNEVTSIGSGAFQNCSGLQKVIVPNISAWCGISFADNSANPLNYVHHIYSNENTEIKELIIPDGVTSIGKYAFYGCSGLTSVTIPNSVTSVGNYAFSGCSSLQKVIVPDIAAWCGISFGDNPLYYANHIYRDENTEIKELVIPDGVTSIGNYAFYGCSGLTSVTIPNSVASIGNSAFNGCSGIEKVVISDIAKWCSFVFGGYSDNPLYYAHHIYSDKNTEITEIVIPEGVNIIGQYAFYNCENITSVTIPSSVTSIGKNAFSCGIKLSTVNVNMNIPIELDESVFEFTGENYSKDIIYLAATLNVPIGSKALYSNVKGWKKFMNINEVDFTPKHKLVYVVDGVEYKVYEIAEGATITPEPAPTKEGYTFSGWSEIPATMPAYDVTVTGTFSINKYKLTYMVDGTKYKTYELKYGATITPEPAPTKEGYTFSGWSEIPETMPAHDVTVTGTFSINKYKLTYKVDGVEYKSYELEYGATITPEPAPTKEGYTFSGWSEIPKTMPAHDVTVTGSFAVNQYLITYMIGDEVYQKEYVDYGATIVLPNVPEREGYSFAWIDAPEKMPAHDITINGAYTSGMWGVSNDDATTNTYTISGYKTDKPRRGVNIIRMSDGTTRKVVVK